MRSLLFTFLILPIFAHTQEFALNILNKDSFTRDIQKVTMNGYIIKDDGQDMEPMSSVYFELDSIGSWKVRIVTYSDGDESRDSVIYNPKTRTKVLWTTSDFEPGKVTTVYNTDSTIKSIYSQPGQRDPQLTEYFYDGNKRCVKTRVTFVENITETEYGYDEFGRPEYVRRSSGAVSSKTLQTDMEEYYEYQPGDNGYLMYRFYYGAGEEIRVRDTVMGTLNDRYQILQEYAIMENSKWRKTTTWTYDTLGRVTSEHIESDLESGEHRVEDKMMQYDSLGFYKQYSDEETSYSFSRTWDTKYNVKGLPQISYFKTEAETFYYEWIYVYRD
jgi:hypothetical protein